MYGKRRFEGDLLDLYVSNCNFGGTGSPSC